MKTFRQIISLTIVLLLFSCDQNSDEQAINSDTINNLYTVNKDTANQDPWNFNKCLMNPDIPQLAKDIFKEKWKLKDDEPLQFLKQLDSKDKTSKAFYFKVVTNAAKQADGSFAEGLGSAGYNYVKRHPSEFTNYFIGKYKFSEADLDSWVDITMTEFQYIEEPKYGDSLMQDYLDSININCKNCTKDQKEVVTKFSEKLLINWSEFLKNIDN